MVAYRVEGIYEGLCMRSLVGSIIGQLQPHSVIKAQFKLRYFIE